MNIQPPKKMLILNILDILRRYTDENHRLSQKEIVDLLAREYDMKADRKSIRRNILNLIDCGHNIEYKESIRMVPNAKTGQSEESYIWSDFYLERIFTDGELRLLIDSLLFSQHVPSGQCRKLVNKLENLSNIYFRSRTAHIACLNQPQGDNQQIFLNVELLDEAINRGRKVSFHYVEYGVDKQPHLRCRPDGTVRTYIINPYQMAARQGKYYLICNYDKYDNIANFRLDRIRDLQVLDEPIKPFETLQGSNGQRLDLSHYMAEHIYMYASDSTRVTFRIKKALVSEIIDAFGKNIKVDWASETQVCFYPVCPDCGHTSPKYSANVSAGERHATVHVCENCGIVYDISIDRT